MAGRAGRRRRDRLPVQYRQVPDRALHRKQRGCLQLWGGGRSDCTLLWIYYSTQIFLLGAEFTKVYAHLRRLGYKYMKAMQHRGSESKSFTATEDESFRSELSEAGSPLLDSVAREGRYFGGHRRGDELGGIGSHRVASRPQRPQGHGHEIYITGEQ